MKTILLLTDFTQTSETAFNYGYQLASVMNYNVVLCNVMNVPAEIPQFEAPVWPLSGYDHVILESKHELKLIKNKLELLEIDSGFRPGILCIEEVGRVTEIVLKLILEHHIELVVIGIHTNKGIVEWALGNHVQELIDLAKIPVLIVPTGSHYAKIGYIALATTNTNMRIGLLSLVAGFAEKFKAALFLFKVEDSPHDQMDNAQERGFLENIKKITGKLKVSVHYALKGPVEKQLHSLCTSEKIDLLIMTHARRSLVNDLLLGSHCRTMAKQTKIPLLIFPETPNL